MFKVKLQIDANDVAGMIAAHVDQKIESYEGLEHLAESEKECINAAVYEALSEWFKELDGEVLE
jgi:hypothetical protein